MKKAEKNSEKSFNFRNLFSRSRGKSIVAFSHSEDKPNSNIGKWVHFSKKENLIPSIKDQHQFSHFFTRKTLTPNKVNKKTPRSSKNLRGGKS